MQKVHFGSIADYHTFFNLPAPEHPMLSVVTYDGSDDVSHHACIPSEPFALSTDFYSISLKTLVSGELLYGRTKYDFQNGTMIFTAPRQELVARNLVVSSQSATICFHEDFIEGHAIRNRIKKCGFFSYTMNEALHLSPREELLVQSIFKVVEAEYQNNQDEFSKEIILSQIDTLLKYASRFYKRQFIHRSDLSGKLLRKFETKVANYFESHRFLEEGPPKPADIAREMKVSPRYLSDTLKVETGKTAKELIQLALIDEAKDLLLEPQRTVSETAYQLGFEYPQYFSRLFKKKVGMTPSEFRKQYAVH